MKVFFTAALCVALAAAQNTPAPPAAQNPPAATPVQNTPAATAVQNTPAATPAQSTPAPTAEDYTRQQKMLQDWPNLARYHDADAALPPPAPGENRVVFMGDSITDGWGTTAGEFFPGKPYINRGISGQTTPQMLVRFRPDVIALQPKVVVILAGTNDIAGNTGPETPEDIEDNLMSMVDLARANGIRVVLASVLPAFDYPWRPGVHPAQKIADLNSWIRSYAAKNGLVYVDYYAAMVDDRMGLLSNLTTDGVHPNKAGYAVMAPLAEKAIAQALEKP